MQFIFPRGLKTCQDTDISVLIKNNALQLCHQMAMPSMESKAARPAIWITHAVMGKVHKQSCYRSPISSKGWHELDDSPVCNHWLNWATSICDDSALRFAIQVRLHMLETPAQTARSKGVPVRCPFCQEVNPDAGHIFGSFHHAGLGLIVDRHHSRGGAVLKTIKRAFPGVETCHDRRIREICATITDEEDAIKQPDLVFDSGVQKKGSLRTRKVLNLVEIARP
jgi:hypothetical protein